MPAVSKAQKRLMSMAYAYKKGDLKSSEVSKTIKDIADSMSLKDLNDYAETSEKGLPEKVKEAIIRKYVQKRLKEFKLKLNIKEDHLVNINDKLKYIKLNLNRLSEEHIDHIYEYMEQNLSENLNYNVI